jgi:hypothetical protein
MSYLEIIMLLIALTAAEEFSMICTMIYAPKCATEGVNTKTFTSACTMVAFNCRNTETSKLQKMDLVSKTAYIFT